MPGDKDPAASEAPAAETQPAEPETTTKAEEEKAEGGKTVEEKKENAEEKKEEGGKMEDGKEKKVEEEEELKVEEEEEKKEEEKEGEEAKPRMKSVVLTGYGGMKMVKVQQRRQPTPAEGQVLIRVSICGMGFQDLMLRQGYTDSPIPRIPLIMGQECAGVVEALGPDTTGFNVGDRVMALTNYKAWAELVAVPATHVYKLPDKVDFQQGVCLLMHYVTAYCLLFDLAGLRQGQSLLLHSAAGGVGQAILQLCATVGDVTIYGTASCYKHHSVKGKLTHFFAHTVDYAQEIKKLSPEGVDVVLDCLCGEDTKHGIALLKPMGKYFLYGSSNLVSGDTKSFFSFAKSWWQVDKVSPVKLFEENRTIGGFHLRHLLFRKNQHAYVRTVVNRLLELFDQGKVAPVIDSVWAFEDVADAMLKLQDRKNIGKVLLHPTMEPIAKERADSKAAAEAEKTVTESGEQAKEESGQQAKEESGQKTETTETPAADDAQ